MPPIDGLAEARPWGNREATTAEAGPGAAAGPRRRRGRGRDGPGLEQPRLERCRSSRPRTAILRRRGAVRRARRSATRSREPASTLRVGVKAVGAARGEGGQVSLRLEDGEELRGDELLVAVGRRPRTDDIGARDGRRSSPAASSRSTTSCGSTARTGCTRSATSTAARCSPTWASTRRGSAPTTCSARTSRASCDKVGPPRVVFTDPEVAAVGQDTRRARRRTASTPARSTSRPRRNAGASFRGRNTRALRGSSSTRARGVIVGATFVGHRDRRVAARRDDRRQRGRPARPPLARGAGVPDPIRDLAEAARGVRAVRRSERSRPAAVEAADVRRLSG